MKHFYTILFTLFFIASGVNAQKGYIPSPENLKNR